MSNMPSTPAVHPEQNSVKVVTRHIWDPYLERCEELRHTLGNKQLYEQRKETIERCFGTAKEYHGLRYTNLKGMARMKMKLNLNWPGLGWWIRLGMTL